MSNIILFADNPPRNTGSEEIPMILNYQTRTAGPYAIASHLRRLGYSVLVVDHCISVTFSGVKKIIDENSDGLLWVGLSTTFFSFMGKGLESYRTQWRELPDLYFNDAAGVLSGVSTRYNLKLGKDIIWGVAELNLIAKYCQEKYQIPMVIGGAWTSSMKDGNLSGLEKNIHIAYGRAELFVEKFTFALRNKNYNDLPIIVNNDHFDDVLFKENTYLYVEQDNISEYEWLPLEVSRGCAFNCSFCNFDRRSSFDSYRNPKSIYDEILRNYDKFGVTKYILMDDLYNDSKEKVRDMYNEVWSKLPFEPEWTSYMRLDMIWHDPDSIKIIQDSGAKMGSFGIETLHHVAGKRVGKGLGKDRILNTLEKLKTIWKDDVIRHGYFITGLPDEPETSILETIDWVSNTDLLHSTVYTPLWVTPPAHKSLVLNPSTISKDVDKFNIKWISDDNWVNNQGVTFQRAKELAELGTRGRKGIIGSFGDYPEYRQIGWSHADIVGFSRDSKQFLQAIQDTASIRTEKILDKIKTRLNIK
jgi:hypothetical protein